jgi:hypothetical protein
MRRCARRVAMRRISCTDQRIRSGVWDDFEPPLRSVVFWELQGCVCAMTDSGHHCEGEHHQRDVAMPAMPRAGFIVIEPKFILGGLKAVFDRPAASFDGDQGLQFCPGRTPGGEVGKIAIAIVFGDRATDQEAPCP